MSTVIEATDLYRFYRAGDEEVLALRGVGLRVEAGEVVAVSGPSGSGKSTLLGCLAGLDEPSGGTVVVRGRRLTGLSEAARARLRARDIGILRQHGNLLAHLTVEQNLRIVQRLVAGPGLPSPRDLLDRLGVGDRSAALPAELSGGESARCALAVALAAAPPLVLADEPTGELDSGMEREVLRLLRERADEGVAVLVVTHSPRVVAAADREIRLTDGRVTQ